MEPCYGMKETEGVTCDLSSAIPCGQVLLSFHNTI